MEWGIKLKSNREDLFKKRFWTLVGKMIISFTIIAVFFILLKRIIELSDFQWLYDIDSVSYYRSIETFNKLYYNGTVYIVVATLAIIIFLILLYKEIKHMTSYINIISDSSERLFDGSEEYIDLPPEMKELEVKLNHFRSESIKNKKSAEENEKKKDELIVYLAHDIKTPLTVVIGYLSLLDEIEDMPLEQRKKYIELALNKSYRLEELINEFFDITRFNLSVMTLEKETIHFSRMLEQIVSEFEPILQEKRLSVESVIEKDIILSGDADKLERVFDNLLRNAVNYSYPDTVIHLLMKRMTKEHKVLIRVQNHGRTIAKEKLEHIFEQFFRVDASRSSATGGSGLGLAIARQIVEMHYGQIRAESADETIVFEVELPCE